MKMGNWLFVILFVTGVIIFVMMRNWPARANTIFHPTKNTPTIVSTESPTLPPYLTLPPKETTVFTQTATLTPPPPPPCIPKYLPMPAGWNSNYISTRDTLLQDIYPEIYNENTQSKYDLDAIAYYNNRKVLEQPSASYNVIDPNKLYIGKEWKIFLPPLDWIRKYRDLPAPVLFPILDAETLKDATIYISGSSNLYSLSSKIATCFKATTKVKNIEIESTSTKSGLFDFCQGKAHIFAASEGSVQGCAKVTFYRFLISKYVVTIFINKKNPYAKELLDHHLNNQELVSLLTSANSWKSVRDDFQSEKTINRYYPSVDGGVFEIVAKEIFPNVDPDTIKNLKDTDESLIPGEVMDDVYSVGFASYDEYQKNKDNLIALAINGTLPSQDTIKSKNQDYPLAHDLYLFTGKTTYDENDLLKYFLNYYLAYEYDFIEEPEYFYPNKVDFLENPFTVP